MATECSSCHKEIRSQQTEDDAVEVLESIDTTEPTVVCPQCGGSNFLGTEFCYLCNSRLHPLLGERSPSQHPAAPSLDPATAAKLMLGLAAAVVVLLIGVIAIVNAGVRAFSDRSVVAQDRQDYVVTSRLTPDPAGSGAAQPEVIEEQLPVEPSALQRYKADRAKHPEKYKSAIRPVPSWIPAGATNVSISSKVVRLPEAKYAADYVLPLPSRGKFNTDRRKTGKKYVSGKASYSVDRRLGDVWKTYELEKLLPPCVRQDLWPTSSVREYKGGRSDDDVSRFSVDITLRDYKDCFILIELMPSESRPKTSTRILVTYTIPKGRTIRLSTSANGK